MTDTDFTIDMNIELPEKNWTLEIMNAVFGDSLSIENDYEYAISVLLGYATEGAVEGDAEDALREALDTIEQTNG